MFKVPLRVCIYICLFTYLFAVVGDLLTKSVFAGLSKENGSIVLKLTIQSQEKHFNIALQTLYTLELDLGPFQTDGAHFLPNHEIRHLLHV